GQSSPGASYLSIEKIVEACLETDAAAVHPGYGFLSENADFARRIKEAGLLLAGPPADAVGTMVNELQAKEAAREFGVPRVPGTLTAINHAEEAKQVADELGLPLTMKGAARGGGKGTRIVEVMDELEDPMELAMKEA